MAPKEGEAGPGSLLALMEALLVAADGCSRLPCERCQQPIGVTGLRQDGPGRLCFPCQRERATSPVPSAKP